MDEQQSEPKPARPYENNIVKIVLAVVVTALLIGGGVYWWQQAKMGDLNTRISELVKQNDELRKIKEEEAAKERRKCVDSDVGRDYSVKGVIDFKDFDESGSIRATSNPGDVCTSAEIDGETKENVLREHYCDENNNVQYEHYVCPERERCEEGACVQEPPPLKTVSFSHPYPVSWYNEHVTYSLTGVSLGEIPAYPYLIKSSGLRYEEGDMAYALILEFKIHASLDIAGLGTCPVVSDFRRVADEAGNMLKPSTWKQDFFYDHPEKPGTFLSKDCFDKGTISEGQKIIFVVPEDEEEFYIKNIRKGVDVFFTVKVSGDTLKVETESARG